MQIATITPVLTVVFGVLLMILILLQRPQTDSAGAFSSEGGTGTHTRRGAEKTFFRMTIISGVLFVASALYTFLLGA